MTVRYRYAEPKPVKHGDRWFIVFWAYDPAAGQLRRKRESIGSIRNARLRERYARKEANRINDKLDKGWSPWTDLTAQREYQPALEVLQSLLDYYSASPRAKRTINSYSSALNRLMEYLRNNQLEGLLISDFIDEIACDFMGDFMKSRKLSGKAFNNYLTDYRTFFNRLVKQRYLHYNAFHAVDREPETETDKRPFTIDELERYVDHIFRNDFPLFIASGLCYYCGVRPKEICLLQRQDVDFEKQLLTVPAQRKENGEYIRVSKSRKKRIVPVSDLFMPYLVRYLEGSFPGYFIIGKGFEPGIKAHHRNRLSERFRPIARMLEIPDEVDFYCLKDNAALALLDAGFTIDQIRDFFGHSDIKVTDNYLKRKKGGMPRNPEDFVKKFPGLV